LAYVELVATMIASKPLLGIMLSVGVGVLVAPNRSASEASTRHCAIDVDCHGPDCHPLFTGGRLSGHVLALTSTCLHVSAKKGKS